MGKIIKCEYCQECASKHSVEICEQCGKCVCDQCHGVKDDDYFCYQCDLDEEHKKSRTSKQDHIKMLLEELVILASDQYVELAEVLKLQLLDQFE